MAHPQLLNIGFIGLGVVGQMHLQHWLQLKNCKVVALSDLRPNLLAQVGKKYNISKLYNNHIELLANSEIEVVVVVTHRNNTASVVYDCLQSGKHVFSEKAIARTVEQAK